MTKHFINDDGSFISENQAINRLGRNAANWIAEYLSIKRALGVLFNNQLDLSQVKYVNNTIL